MLDPPHTPVTADELAHAFEEAPPRADLSRYAIEDWLTLLLFWVMAGCVFLQFFTRYVLNDSYAWTEEIAINALVVVVFLGAVMCVRLSRHIQVDIVYRYLPRVPARVLAIGVDLVRLGFFGYMTWLFWRYIAIVGSEQMVTVDLPRGPVFYTVLAAFALMTLRSVQVFVADLRRGYSVLERPEEFSDQGD